MKRIMHNCFMYMMQNGFLKNQSTLMNCLKSIITVLGSKYNLTESERNECLVYFLEDYSKGCSSPIPESYMRGTLIPAINQMGRTDIPLGVSIVMIAENN